MWWNVVWSTGNNILEQPTVCTFLISPSHSSLFLILLSWRWRQQTCWQLPHNISEVLHMATTHGKWHQECGNAAELGWTPSVSAEQDKLKISLSDVCCCPLYTSNDRWGGKDSFPSHILTLDESQMVTWSEVSKRKSTLPKIIMHDFLLWHTCAGIVPPQTSGNSTYYNKPLRETVQPAHHHSQCCCNMVLSCFKTLQHLVTIITSRICCRTGTSLHCLTRISIGLQPINFHFNGRITRNLEGIMLGGGHVLVIFCMAHK